MNSRRRSSEGFPSREAERLFEQNIPLADRLARRFSFGQSVDDDLRQVAHLGLLLACRRFDPELGEFVRFASVTIIGELKKHLRTNGWSVRVPRALQEDSITVAAAVERLTSRLGHSPSVGEVAEHTGFDRERVAEAIRTREARFSASVEEHHIEVASADDGTDAALIELAVARLPDDQRRLIEYRRRDGLTQAEIGRLIGISQPQVHRRLADALAALHRELAEGDQ